jgi:hypothetical protein
VPEYNSGSGTYFTEKYRVIVILFVRVTLLLPGSSKDFIIGHKELKELLLLYINL